METLEKVNKNLKKFWIVNELSKPHKILLVIRDFQVLYIWICIKDD